ncbi:uncharacterized protein LTR77_004103 [Saxophila tyrrhenica]|uniref:Tautomerase cis-CaaD-like domain-containing protein n=1 Tax=Saxophila tyrrhenica TaxID=1690608 RepID=A0AAV9PBP3_9PEZI|nr:hypothetical protein LTR77_004103 [Saxophila tyrrhenica]
MPTYTCTCSAGRLSPTEKQSIVNSITKVHSEEGGNVPQYLVQVVFNELAPGNHFINKRLVPKDQLWVNGLIRAGRSDAQKTAMVKRIMSECSEAMGVDPSFVWAYICDAEKTAEFGSVLPEPGQEKAWVEAIPKEVRDRYGLY